MKVRKTLVALGLVAIVSVAAACGADSTESTAAESSATESASSSGTETDTTTSSSGTQPAPEDLSEGGSGGAPIGGEGGAAGTSVDPSSVTTEEQLVALIQEAYGDGGLGLHRGHEPVQDVLDEVLTISHDELHVRMEEQGQNLASVAEDLGIDPQTLIGALVESWSPAIDSLLENGTITADEADAYRAALEEAFTFRVTWDGEEATPTFTGIGG
ncbi:hypothetical protein E1262_28285 [Jiangella aurantiaca]|uniref:Lipoprotein n=1 Tax=Jiangella aurantiaca TaxID=2530373 RepID=A0A4R5A1M3_9ACTN|nr:hypothetical protein [Jiangella aurantiaca]TDD64399.1 hypothetical protein E1262_28285 [Jiangella aurantiaca]